VSNDQVKRRLLTILAADVAGFSRLVAEDEEGTLRRLNACLVEVNARIRAHDGRLVKTAGDGLLAAFESPVEALRCAVGLQRALGGIAGGGVPAGRLLFRIGLNLGDVLVQEGDLLGDAVNIAARLEGEALPGGICLSGAVHEHVAGKIDAVLEDLGERALRNIPRPVRVWRVAGLGHKAVPPPRPNPPPRPLDEPGEPPLERPVAPEIRLAADAEDAPSRGRRRGVSVLAISIAVAVLAAVVAGALVLLRTSSVGEIETRLGTAKPPAPAPTAPAQPPAPAPAQVQPVAPALPAPALPTPTLPAPAEPPSPRRFAADQVPFVSDAVRARLATDYANGAASRALAISRGNGTAWFVVGQPNDEEAGRRAVNSCLRNAPEPCELYAVGDRLVGERLAPPMPPRPYAPPAEQRLALPFAPDLLPLAGPGMRDRLRAEYGNAAAHKSVAIARSGTVGFAVRRASEAEATRAALELCGDLAGSPCAIAAIDDHLVAPAPTSTTATGLFDPGALPIPPTDRERVAQAYLAGGGYKAIALDRAGKLGMAVGRDSEARATADALADCRAQGGQDCLVQVIGIYTVIGR